MTTLTTVGYGDATPAHTLGKLWSMLTMLFGLCILALPVAIISTGFAQEVGRRDFVITWSLMSRIPLLAELDAKRDCRADAAATRARSAAERRNHCARQPG